MIIRYTPVSWSSYSGWTCGKHQSSFVIHDHIQGVEARMWGERSSCEGSTILLKGGHKVMAVETPDTLAAEIEAVREFWKGSSDG